MNENEVECKVLHTYYGRAQGKSVVSLKTVRCPFENVYIAPPEPVVPPVLNSWVDELSSSWLDNQNNQWEA